MTPIIDLLSEEVKSDLKSQVDHLEKMSVMDDYEDGVYMDKFNAMHQGAKTLMYILEETEFGKSGIENFLKQLNRDQLKHTISSAEKLLKAKESKGTVILYYVDGGNENGWFYDKKDAEAYFPIAALESVENGYPEVSFGSTAVYVEELEDYLGKELADKVRVSL